MSHARRAEVFQEDAGRARWHDETLWQVRGKRDQAAASVPEWEELREAASRIKRHTLSKLDHYLEELETSAKRNGVIVHWASNGEEHNRIVAGLLHERGVTRVVKSKSMLTEECGLNPWLETQGIEVIDTDLGERIVQLAGERPSHLVMPAIHKKREEVDELFHRTMGTKRSGGDPVYLTRAARKDLRGKFLQAEAGITGVNFAVAETGELVICTNEGNADLGMHLPPIHIACMGLEKVIPKREHLGVFLRLLARSATGQPITSYTSHVATPQPGREIHLVLVDNGRTEQLSRTDFYTSLSCIRCAACLNTCPIYRRSGGHSYGSTIPGPIGAILEPGKDLEAHADLPFASTLCGSCSEVCPVKIPIHKQLYRWRQLVTEQTSGHNVEGGLNRMGARLFRHPRLFSLAGRTVRWALRWLPRRWHRHLTGSWGLDRDLPEIPAESFQSWVRSRRRDP
ncbi:MAG: lactate utilization protein B [Bacteroidota bacterium]